MRQYKLCIQIIIIIIIVKKKRDKNHKGGTLCEDGRRGEREILIFFLFASFSDLRKSDRRFSPGLKTKLIYAMRATRRHQNIGV